MDAGKVGLGRRRTEDYSLGKNKEGGGEKDPKEWENTKSRNRPQFSADCFMPPTPLVFLLL